MNFRATNLFTLSKSPLFFFYLSSPYRYANDRAIQQINNPQLQPIAHHTLCRSREEIKKKNPNVNSSFHSPPSDGGLGCQLLEENGKCSVVHYKLFANVLLDFGENIWAYERGRNRRLVLTAR